MTTQIPVDHPERERALDPSGSFIVQAPAGSGKTELLTQRYLRLLSLVNEPEEILAITFTRKAAAEMRNRIVKALTAAGSEPEPGEPHLAKTRDLAIKALKQDKKLGWNILNNPARLKVRTIDSFCLYLTGRMPVLTGLGGDARVMEDPRSLYEQAARSTLLELKRDSRWHDPLSVLLLHLDNDWTRAGGLIVDMLSRREHWLRLVSRASGEEDLRSLLEGQLCLEVERRLNKALNLFNQFTGLDEQKTFFECACYASLNLSSENKVSAITALAGMNCLPDARISNLDKWLGIMEMLQTNSGSWRKGVDKRIGFPAASSCADKDSRNQAARKKALFQDFLNALAGHSALQESLAELASLPDTIYSDETWEILSALLQVLKMAVAQLQLVMQDMGRVDYSEISMAALHALGESDNPSELLLRLDYQLKHILFDEFQDTSISQQEMIARLVSGWTPGDGRSLFVVGDPMQSIYGFRDADVGVFLKAGQEGIGDLFLEPLSLSVNFRSGPEVVDWVNRVFPYVFQDTQDHVSGSVIYSHMWAGREIPGLVRVHPFIEPGPEDEARKVVEIINQTTKDHPGENIAVLVRSRTHLSEIVKKLRQGNLSFQAVEVEPLRDRQVVMDLLSLTRALIRPQDNLAWLCVLRAPWAGLDLKDLSRLSIPGDDETILEKLHDLSRVEDLSPEGFSRLQRAGKILVAAWENRLRRPLSRLVEGVWTALGGPACLKNRQELEDAMAFLERLESYEQNQTIEDLPDFEKTLQGLFSRPDPDAQGLLQIMTIHKAKGLEFDTVILPGLDKPPRNADKLLLQFMEVPSEEHEQSSARLLLAPMASYGQEVHPTYRFIENLKKLKEEHETGRLIYVAATRARKRLHLLASARLNNLKNAGTLLCRPRKNSLLDPLWTQLECLFEDACAPDRLSSQAQAEPGKQAVNLLTRLSREWVMPGLKAYNFAGSRKGLVHEIGDPSVTYHWAGDAIRHIGVSVHNFLARIADQGPDKWDDAKVDSLAPGIRSSLQRLGVSRAELDFACAKVILAVKNTLSDPKGRWILSRHRDAGCEYCLSALADGEVIRVVMDRTFIDEHETRWIIDYKTSVHEGGGLEVFLDSEMERYQGQLRKYMRIFKMKDQRIVRAGLYFPLLKAWREIRE